MKKIISLLLAAVLILSTFTGCKLIDKFKKAEEPEETSEATLLKKTILLEECSELRLTKLRGILQETGCDPIVSMNENDYYLSDGGSKIYRNVTVNYYAIGFGKYKTVTLEDFENIQKYQNETGRQVIYPTVEQQDRPTTEKNKYDANIYYVTENPKASVIKPSLSLGTIFVKNYWKYNADEDLPPLVAEYNSLRIEGADGFVEGKARYFYAYGRRVENGVEVRVFLFEYYLYLMTCAEMLPDEHYYFDYQIKNPR